MPDSGARLDQVVAARLDQAAPALAAAGVQVARQITEVPHLRLDEPAISGAIDAMIRQATALAGRGSRLRVTVKAGGRTVMVSVKATGHGLSAGEREALFAESVPPGPLAGVRSIMRAHGGGAWANGMPGRGVTFYATLAAAPPA